MRSRRLAVDVAALAFLAVTALVFRLIAFPQAVIDWDESVYLLMARSMLQGHMPYTAVWDHKPPGVYVLFLLAQVLFGQSILSIRILAVLAVTASCFLLYLYGRNVLGSRRIGLLAGLFYAIFSLQNGGMATHTEILMTPFVVGAFYLMNARAKVPAAIQLDRLGVFFLVGLALGAAIQIKTLAAFEALAVVGLIVSSILVARRQQRPLLAARVTAALALVALGILLPFLLAVVWFAAAGDLRDFYYANFTANFAYLHQARLSLDSVVRSLFGQVRNALVLWAGFVLAILLVWTGRRRRPLAELELTVLGTWFFSALLGVLWTRRLFQHYYLEVLAPLCLIAAFAIVNAALADTRLRKKPQAVMAVGIVLLALAKPLAGPVQWNVREVVTLARRTPRVDVSVYIARYLDQQMAPDDFLYVADGQPILYFLTDAKIPTKYVQPANLNRTEIAAIIGEDPLQELDSIMRRQPKYVVLGEEYDQDPAFYDRLQDYLARGYLLERTIQGVRLYRRAG